jgi:hypothetical protein
MSIDHDLEMAFPIDGDRRKMPDSLLLLVGQLEGRLHGVDQRLAAVDDSLNGFKDTAGKLEKGQGEMAASHERMMTLLESIQKTQIEQGTKLSRVDTAITWSALANSGTKIVPWLIIGSMVASVIYWFQSHYHWGPKA